MIRKSLEERISIYVLHMLINTLFIWEQNGLKLHYPTSWQYPLINYLDLAMPLRPSIGTLPPPNSLFTVCIRFKQENTDLPEAWEIAEFTCSGYLFISMYVRRKESWCVYLSCKLSCIFMLSTGCWVKKKKKNIDMVDTQGA